MPDMQIVETRSFSLACSVAKTATGYRWRFPNAFMNWSSTEYDSIEAAFAAAQQFAVSRMVPITPSRKD